MNWDEGIKLYDALVAKCTRFKRKGKSVPYTSANGYMFSLLNKEGEIGIRFSKEIQQAYLTKFDTKLYESHGATMKGYILITDKMLMNLDEMAACLDESYDYVMSLKPK